MFLQEWMVGNGTKQNGKAGVVSYKTKCGGNGVVSYMNGWRYGPDGFVNYKTG